MPAADPHQLLAARYYFPLQQIDSGRIILTNYQERGKDTLFQMALRMNPVQLQCPGIAREKQQGL
jgi:hypothetical protein